MKKLTDSARTLLRKGLSDLSDEMLDRLHVLVVSEKSQRDKLKEEKLEVRGRFATPSEDAEWAMSAWRNRWK